MNLKYLALPIISAVLLLNSCALGDKIEEKAKALYEKAKKKYAEYRGEGEQDQPRPFKVVYQSDPSRKTPIFVSNCGYNQPVRYVYFETPTDAGNGFIARTNSLVSAPGAALKPFWDIRYINPVTAYIAGTTKDFYPDHSPYTGLDARSGANNLEIGTSYAQTDPAGSVTQSKCVNGVLAGGASINLFDAPLQSIYYAGPQNTFVYRFDTASHISPWKANGTGNLMMQASFKKPIYINYEQNIGGGVYFNLFIRNKRSGAFLNFVIGLYAAGEAWIKEKRGIQFDPTTNIVHVATVASDESWWSTVSRESYQIQEIQPSTAPANRADNQWPEFYRVNISYQNLAVVLQELQKNPPAGAAGRDFGLNPAEWEVTSMMIQYELVEEGGKAQLSGSFRGFEGYISDLPL
jgi:hypothetical protein